MSYSDFLDLISNGCTLFLNTLYQVANSLMSNYFFITILGLAIFIYLFERVSDIIFNPSDNIMHNMEKWDNSKRDYLMNLDVKSNVIQTHPNDIHNYKYMSLVMNKDAQLDYLHAYEGFEYMIKSVNMKLGREVAIDSFSVNKDLEYKLKMNNLALQKEVKKDYNKALDSKDKSVLPNWFNKDIKKKKMTKKEKKELDDIIENF